MQLKPVLSRPIVPADIRFQSLTAPAAPPSPMAGIAQVSALITAGRLPEAVRLGRKARLHAPAVAEVHYTLGLAYLERRALLAAEGCFRTAVRLVPGFSLAWLNLGVTLYRLQRMTPAKEALRQALRADPDNEAAAANLGALMRLSGEEEAGERLLRETVARFPQNRGARLNLAADLLKDDHLEEAMALIGTEPPEAPGLRSFWGLQRALGLIKQNSVAEAQALLAGLGPVPPRWHGLWLWRQILLADAVGNGGKARRLALHLEDWLAKAEDALPEHRLMGYYDLGKFWSSRNNRDRAFGVWTQGHRALARLQPFSRSRYQAFVEATLSSFGAERFCGARAYNRDPAPVFIVGMPRSGTTLMEQILAAHPQVHGAGERPDLGRTFYQLGEGTDTAAAVRRVAGADMAALDRTAETYLQRLHALNPAATHILDKMPGNFQYLGLAGLLMPGARIIACERDPRDIGLSIFSFRFYGLHPYAHDLGDLGWYMGQKKRLMEHWQAVLPNPILTVRLSDWVEDFESTLRRVLSFLDLSYDVACEQFYDHERGVKTVSRQQVRQPINARGIGRWRAYAAHLAPLVAALEEGGVLPDEARAKPNTDAREEIVEK